MKKQHEISRIGIVGAGNVASHISVALLNKGFTIEQVINKTEGRGRSLAAKLNAKYIGSLRELDNSLECLILAVPDRVIPELVAQLGGFKGLIVHTSGSVSIEVFKKLNTSFGVLYPLQTFTIGRNLNFSTIPLFIEGSDEKAFAMIENIAIRISEKVISLDSEKRANLHLAAVFACNFSNFLLAGSHNILEKEGIEKSVLNPLIKETAAKALDLGPVQAQTGPAIRGDNATIKKHLDLLSCYPELKQIYKFLSQSIQNFYSSEAELNR